MIIIHVHSHGIEPKPGRTYKIVRAFDETGKILEKYSGKTVFWGHATISGVIRHKNTALKSDYLMTCHTALVEKQNPELRGKSVIKTHRVTYTAKLGLRNIYTGSISWYLIHLHPNEWKKWTKNIFDQLTNLINEKKL